MSRASSTALTDVSLSGVMTSPEDLVKRVQALEARNKELERALVAERTERLQVHHQVEEEEEYILNKVALRLDSLRSCSAKQLGQVGELEDMAGTLRHRMQQIHARKLVLEKQLTAESQYELGDLQAQLELVASEKASLQKEKADLENALEAEQEFIFLKLHKKLLAMQNDKKALLIEKSQLQKTIHEMSQRISALTQEKVDLSQRQEMEDEAFVNKLLKQLLQVMQHYKKMAKVLESHGIRITHDSAHGGAPALRRSSHSHEARAAPADRATSGASVSASVTSVTDSPVATPFELVSERSAVEASPTHADSRRSSMSQKEMRLNASLHSMGLSMSLGHVRRQDSGSSMGSGMSAMSRDVSSTRGGDVTARSEPRDAPAAALPHQQMQVDVPASGAAKQLQ